MRTASRSRAWRPLPPPRHPGQRGPGHLRLPARGASASPSQRRSNRARAATPSYSLHGRGGTCTHHRSHRSPFPCSPCRCRAGSRSGTLHDSGWVPAGGPGLPSQRRQSLPAFRCTCDSCSSPGTRLRHCPRRSLAPWRAQKLPARRGRGLSPARWWRRPCCQRRRCACPRAGQIHRRASGRRFVLWSARRGSAWAPLQSAQLKVRAPLQ
mmetsp:Transcript_34/g.104  ORF Transcript_34/g.104 Transcript_34/m.104 type:complete len:210 (+) Transcript_34:396-1025(+)